MAVTWNPADKGAGVTLSNGNLTASYPSSSVESVRATISKSAGKWYYEVHSDSDSSSNLCIGLGNSSATITGSRFPASAGGIGYEANGVVEKGGGTVGVFAAYAPGDVIGVAFDAGAGTIAFYKNNVLQTTASGANVPTGALFPIIGAKGVAATSAGTANFGATSFAFTPPSGFSGWDTPNSSTLTLPSIVASGVASAGNQSIQTLPSIVASGSGIGQAVGTSAQTLLPWAATGTGTSPVGQAGTSSLSLPFTTVAGSGVVGSVAASSVALPDVVAHGVVYPTGQSTQILPAPQANGVALAGVVGTSVVSLPLSVAAALAGANAVGASAVVLPATRVSSYAYLGTGAAYSAIVMHTESQALWTYSNFGFNSLARFKGNVLAASDAGLFVLGGADDAGTPISAQATLGITDFSTAHQTRVDRVYLGYRSTGNMILRVTVDETDTRDYLVPVSTPAVAGIHGRHVRLGHGVSARYWQFSVLNKDGSDFSLNMLECKPTILRRRVGGRDA